MSAVERLGQLLRETFDLTLTAGLLSWDQDVNMPPGGVEDRGELLATVERLAHERLVAPDTGAALEAAAAEVAAADYDSDAASLVRVTARERERERRVPSELVEAMGRASAVSYPVWLEARARGDWNLFAPRMQVTLDLTHRLVEAIGYQDEPYDALLERDEPGITTKQVDAIFGRLRTALPQLIRELEPVQDRVDDSVLDRSLDTQRQLDFSLQVVRALGYSLDHGRLDLSAHPFTAAVGQGDVRITTRVKRNLRDSCLFSAVHEAGHAMYYQGVPRSVGRNLVWDAASPGVNESQSRLWENQVGRSLPFWKHFFPLMREVFPEALADQTAESYYLANNKVSPSCVRVDADEVTYNLHILLRYELERDLLSGKLRVAEVPDAWNAKLKEYLGLAPVGPAEGCLQDIHWTNPQLGSFVGYTLGNVIAAQLMVAARQALPDLDARIETGDFSPLLAWLREHVHGHGRKFTPNELLVRATGQEITVQPLIDYLTEKYRQVYRLGSAAAAAS